MSVYYTIPPKEYHSISKKGAVVIAEYHPELETYSSQFIQFFKSYFSFQIEPVVYFDGWLVTTLLISINEVRYMIPVIAPTEVFNQHDDCYIITLDYDLHRNIYVKREAATATGLSVELYEPLNNFLLKK